MEKHKLLRVRPPRVKLTYDIENEGAIEKAELPFVFAIIADLCGDECSQASFNRRTFLALTQDNFEQQMAALSPRVIFSIQNVLVADEQAQALAIELVFKSIDDFSPNAVIDQIADLHIIRDNSEFSSRINDQLQLILHHPKFQALEASWRSLFSLVANSDLSKHLHIYALSASKDELQADVKSVNNIEDSALYRKLYKTENNVFSNTPCSVLIGDFEFGHSNDDINVLNFLSKMAQSIHTPFIASAYVSALDVQKPSPISEDENILSSAELAAWQTFRLSSHSAFTTLCLPKILVRAPWGNENGYMSDAFKFEESVSSEAQLWGNAVYALAQRISNAVALYSWPATITGIDGGGRVGHQPNHFIRQSTADSDVKQLLTLSDATAIEELTSLGMIPLCTDSATDTLYFLCETNPSHSGYAQNDIQKTNEIRHSLPVLLCATRFAHYIRVLLKNNTTQFSNAQDIANFLNNWIGNYVLLDEHAPQAIKAAYPLSQANVNVFTPSQGTAYKVCVSITPRFQLPYSNSTVQLTLKYPI